MKKIFYNQNGWVCNRYPYDIPVENTENFIEVEDDIFRMTMACGSYKAWKVVDGVLKIEQYEEVPQTINLDNEFYSIINWFIENDWKVNKTFIGEWALDDQRWLDYLSERNLKRKRLDEINILIKKEKL